MVSRKLMNVAMRYLLLVICTVLMCNSGTAATTARTDRSTIRLTDSVQVVFETDQDVSSRPDFSLLDTDFDVLGTSQSTSVNIINGRMQRSARWLVDLMPKREGVLTIPAIRIGNERSNALTLTVKPSTVAAGEPAGEIFLEVEVDTQNPYVQQQAVLTIRLYRSVQMGNASLTEPNVTGGDVIVERLGDDVGYETQRGGVRYAVVERRYALFAQTSGAAVIEPLRFEGRVPTGRQSVFDPFSQGRPVRVRSETIELDVRPIPAGFAGATWLPADQVFLVESWPDDAIYRVGEPMTRTLTLRANGLISSQLPEIAAGVPDGLRQYPDQPVLENSVVDTGLVGVRQEKVALIPSRAGDLVLPEVTIPWWNTRTESLEFARVPARTITVAPATTTPAQPDTDVVTPIVAPEIDAVSDSEPAQPGAASVWAWVSLGLAIGWFATLCSWWLMRRRSDDAAPRAPRPPTDEELVASVRTACADNDANATKDALLAWADMHWPGSPAHSLGELAARLEGDLQCSLHDLSRRLYRGATDDWQGQPLWEAFEAYRSRPVAASASTEQELEPLYLR